MDACITCCSVTHVVLTVIYNWKECIHVWNGTGDVKDFNENMVNIQDKNLYIYKYQN